MHGKSSFRKQIRRMKNPSKLGSGPSVPRSQVKIGRWLLQENEEGTLEAVNCETGQAILLGGA